jgi:hypothetical protein
VAGQFAAAERVGPALRRFGGRGAGRLRAIVRANGLISGAFVSLRVVVVI